MTPPTRRSAIVTIAAYAHIYWAKDVFAQDKPAQGMAAFDAGYAAGVAGISLSP